MQETLLRETSANAFLIRAKQGFKLSMARVEAKEFLAPTFQLLMLFSFTVFELQTIFGKNPILVQVV